MLGNIRPHFPHVWQADNQVTNIFPSQRFLNQIRKLTTPPQGTATSFIICPIKSSVEIFSASLFPRCAAAGVAWYRQLWPQLLTRSPLLPSSLFCRRLNYSLLCWVNFHLQKPKFQASLWSKFSQTLVKIFPSCFRKLLLKLNWQRRWVIARLQPQVTDLADGSTHPFIIFNLYSGSISLIWN